MLQFLIGLTESIPAYFALYGVIDWVAFLCMLTLFSTILYLVLTSEPKKSIMDSHHYTMYRKLAGAAAKPFDEVKHFSVCTTQNGSKVLMDLGSFKKEVIQQLGGG